LTQNVFSYKTEAAGAILDIKKHQEIGIATLHFINHSNLAAEEMPGFFCLQLTIEKINQKIAGTLIESIYEETCYNMLSCKATKKRKLTRNEVYYYFIMQTGNIA
jgi:hypothetical protein